jgi:glycosyltransferase involved in cell wall biosynthesis
MTLDKNAESVEVRDVGATPTVSVVIPTFNRAATLEQILAPVLGDPTTREAVVVVDGSRDGSMELLERIARTDERVHAVFIENTGEMGAREAGAHAARGDVVLFLDDDVIAGPGLVRGHARRHAGTERLVVVGYMPVDLPARRGPGEFAQNLYSREYERRCATYDHDESRILHSLWAGNFSIRRADVLTLPMRNSGYSERYHPDRDLGLRCLEAGMRGVFDRSLCARHVYARSLTAFASDARSQGAGRTLMHRLHPDVVPRLPPSEFESGLPVLVRAVVRAGRRPRFHRYATAALGWLIVAAGAARAWRVEDDAAKLLRRLEQQRGAIDLAAARIDEAAPVASMMPGADVSTDADTASSRAALEDDGSPRTPSVSAVIGTHNRSHMLPTVVEPLLRDPAVAEVVVVVDGSPDGSYEMLTRMAESDPRVIPLAIERSGRNSARWAGARRSTGDVVLFLDDDVVASDGLASGHARRQARGKGRIVVGYMPVAAQAADANGVASRLYAGEYERTVADYERAPDRILTHLWGGNVSVWREDLERDGCMDDGFAGERHVDRHFGLCCRAAGMTAEFDRSLHATHEHSRSLGRFALDSQEQGAGLFWIHAVHGAVVGPLEVDVFAAGLPAPARWTVELARRPHAHRLIAALLDAGAKLGDRLGLEWFELPFVRLLRRVEQQHGALRAAREAGAAQRPAAASRS